MTEFLVRILHKIGLIVATQRRDLEYLEKIMERYEQIEG